MADPTVVKRALRALAYDTEEADDELRALIERAARSTGHVADTVQFCDAVGVEALDDAVRLASDRGHQALARRGRHVSETIHAYRRVAGESPASDETRDTRGHFHSGRGTPLPGAGQGGDR